jgi:hypothetical protein
MLVCRQTKEVKRKKKACKEESERDVMCFTDCMQMFMRFYFRIYNR